MKINSEDEYKAALTEIERLWLNTSDSERFAELAQAVDEWERRHWFALEELTQLSEEMGLYEDEYD